MESYTSTFIEGCLLITSAAIKPAGPPPMMTTDLFMKILFLMVPRLSAYLLGFYADHAAQRIHLQFPGAANGELLKFRDAVRRVSLLFSIIC